MGGAAGSGGTTPLYVERLVLQTLGEALLDADYAAATVGYLPRVTAEQAWMFFAQVEPWLSRARQSAVDDGYRVDDEVALPAPLPGWVAADPCPDAHLEAMVVAARALGTRLEAALGTVAAAGEPPPVHKQHAVKIRRLAVAADTDVTYARSLHRRGAAPRITAPTPSARPVSRRRAEPGHRISPRRPTSARPRRRDLGEHEERGDRE